MLIVLLGASYLATSYLLATYKVASTYGLVLPII
jgi:hypothetical protein